MEINEANKQTRNPAHTLPLCDGLSIHYTFSAIRVQNRKRGNTANQIKLSLYRSFLKKKVGAEVRLQYTTPLKEVRKSTSVQQAHLPPLDKVLEGVQKLLCKNSALKNSLQPALEQSDELRTKLAVFWIQHRSLFCDKYTESDAEANQFDKMMAQVALCLGNLNLCDLLSETGLQHICSQTSSALRDILHRKAYHLIRLSLNQSLADTSAFDDRSKNSPATQRLHAYASLLQNIFREYLLLQKIPDAQHCEILRRFSRTFVVHPSTSITMGKGLRPKSLRVDDYRLLWKQLTDGPVDSLIVGQMLMLFLGLTAEEVCALDKEDRVPIPHYNAYQLRVTKRYCRIDNTLVISTELERPESYRNIPLPVLLQPFIQAVCTGTETTSVLLPDPETGQRLDPKTLQKAFFSLFSNFSKSSIQYRRDDGRLCTLGTSFRPENYRQSCRHFWQFLCGLQQNEIRYLAGLAQIDTAGRHYIDFCNAHKQYHMCVQLSYGLMAVAAPGTLPSPAPYGSVDTSYKVSGAFGHILHTRLYIRQPCTVIIKTAHGFTIKTEKGGLPWESENPSS